jgi:hypothetical protein
MSYHISCERLRMARLDGYKILQLEHLVKSRLGGTYDSFSVQKLSISRLRMFKCQAMCHATDGHLARLNLRETRVSKRTQYPCNSGGSRSLNVWSGSALCHTTMELITDHTWKKILAQQTEQGPDPGRRRLRMFYELGA